MADVEGATLSHTSSTNQPCRGLNGAARGPTNRLDVFATTTAKRLKPEKPKLQLFTILTYLTFLA